MMPLLPVHDFVFNDVHTIVYHGNKGASIPKHEHVNHHMTVCYAGSIVIRKERVEHVMTKTSKPVLLVGGEWHEIECLEDGTVLTNVHIAGKEE